MQSIAVSDFVVMQAVSAVVELVFFYNLHTALNVNLKQHVLSDVHKIWHIISKSDLFTIVGATQI